ncbi:DHH family phosphoesterase [Fimbriiglobus ruber]|uniref:3'-to-5' oligoribonuclease A n=1 Tax=Fimbriiglobus ruber TaxID=1908690 RepID=A0A225DYH0_9BACT|nr:bifunctional oligoribonuclease/PAP phosphatase NrnA [Fimbriiglobus ruber]OWK46372.1 3'-to-5' oligoribonuclease A [Fimbriiglobus ruber]
MPLDWTPLVDLIRRHQTFLLMTHVRPDADGLGSQLAVADALAGMGKTARVVIASKLAPRYAFLDPNRDVIEDFRLPGDNFRKVDAVIVMDTGTWNQLGDFGTFLRTLNVPKMVVDHHRTQDDLGGIALVDTSAEATGRLAYEIIRALGQTPSKRAAHHMFMALALDTGWFRHSNTTAETFHLAEELVRLGADPPPLYEQLFECAPVSRLKLVGTALQRMQVRAGGKIAFTEVYLRDYEATGAVPGDTEDLINYPRSIDGVEVALLFIEQPGGGTKISFRSRAKVDVSALAEKFQGGGHKRASGAQSAGDLATTRELVLAAAEDALRAAG